MMAMGKEEEPPGAFLSSSSSSKYNNPTHQVPSTPPRGAWEDTPSPLLYSLSSPFSSPGLPTQVRLSAMREERANLLLHQKQQQTEHLQRQLVERDDSICALESKVKDLASKMRLYKEDKMETDELRFRLKVMAEGGSTSQAGLLKEQLGRARSMLERQWHKRRLPARELAAWRAVTSSSIESRERIASSREASRRRAISSAALGAMLRSSAMGLEIQAERRGFVNFFRSHAVTLLLAAVHTWLATRTRIGPRPAQKKAPRAWASAMFYSKTPLGMRLTVAGMLAAALVAAAYKLKIAAKEDANDAKREGGKAGGVCGAE